MVKLKVDFPEKLKCLFDENIRYVVLYGGRAGLKSWGTARALLLRGAKKKLRILCCREIQNSITESVHEVLKLQISLMGLDSFYRVLDTEIRGENGTQFIFSGLRNNVTKIKSFEDVDIAWIEEAANISKASYDILIPTIRKPNSQIILTFNPELEEDETYQRFVMNPPKDSIVIKTTFRDNPWMSDTLKQEVDECKARDAATYDNVWEGNTRTAIEGAIFAEQLRRAAEEARITTVPYDPSKPVNTYWDLGRSNLTAIWFVQYTGMQYRVLRHHSNHLRELAYYLKYVKDLPYTFGTHYFPHDAEQERLGMERTIITQAREILRDVVIVPRVQHKINAIEAAKAIFPLCWFDKDLCADGLSDLRRYHFAMDIQTGKIGKEPQHDIYSDTADAFQCFAMAAEQFVPVSNTRRHFSQKPVQHDPFMI